MNQSSEFRKGTCDKCNLQFEDLGMGWHLVPTGFMIFDITADKDVPELDECRHDGCPGRCEIPVQSHG